MFQVCLWREEVEKRTNVVNIEGMVGELMEALQEGQDTPDEGSGEENEEGDDDPMQRFQPFVVNVKLEPAESDTDSGAAADNCIVL